MGKLTSVLLVDDDPTANYLHETLLEDLEVTWRVLIAHNGKEALDLLQKECKTDQCPELILLDINMPVMNGFEFLEAYKELEITYKQSIVIVMLTTSLNPLDVKRTNSLPVQGFLNKPLTEQMIKDLLGTHFHKGLSK